MIEENYFQLTDIVSFLVWLFIFCLSAHVVYSRNKHKPEYKYYLPHFYWKILAGLGFGIVYTQILGGDTTGYWKGSVALNKLLFESPGDYFYELFSNEKHTSLPRYFLDKEPRYFVSHYKEYNSWSVSRLCSIPCLLSFGSYFTLNLWISVISSWITWRFFKFSIVQTKIDVRWLAVAVLFIPSVGFWCNAITKDAIVYMGILVGFVGFIRLFDQEKRKHLSTYLYILASSFVLFYTRSFILLALVTGFFVAFIFEFNRTKPFIIRMLTRVSGITIALTAIGIYLGQNEALGELSTEALLKNAEVIQQDFVSNKTYTGGKYDLGEIDFSTVGMLKVAPNAIFVALFRPFIWDDVNSMLLINGIESTIMMGMVLYIIFRRKDRNKKYKKREIGSVMMTFSVVFILIMAFFVGFSSGLFGVLVRMRAPLLPFLMIVILTRMTREELVEETDELPEKTTVNAIG